MTVVEHDTMLVGRSDRGWHSIHAVLMLQYAVEDLLRSLEQVRYRGRNTSLLHSSGSDAKSVVKVPIP